MTLKIELLKKIPILLFKRKKFFKEEGFFKDLIKINEWITEPVKDSSKINSIYFDNDELKCYHNRIRRIEGAKLFRFRWYGDQNDQNHIIFPERKTHHESWNYDSSKLILIIILKKKV
jgi:SPX domain protein involved in polyphosphate accumulation